MEQKSPLKFGSPAKGDSKSSMEKAREPTLSSEDTKYFFEGGYSVFLTYEEFYRQFEAFAKSRNWKSSTLCSPHEARTYTLAALQHCHVETAHFHMADTLVFFRYDDWRRLISEGTGINVIISGSNSVSRRAEQLRSPNRPHLAPLTGLGAQTQRMAASTAVAQAKPLPTTKSQSKLTSPVRYKQRRSMGELVQHAWRNFKTKRTLKQLFEACELGNTIAIKRIMQRSPHLLHVRQRNANFGSVFHAAVRSGVLQTLCLLQPTAVQILLTVDSKGNNLLHCACQQAKPQVEMVRLLASIVSRNYAVTDNPLHEDEALFAQLESAASSGTHKGIVKEGWLLKENKHKVWQKRWVVLHRDCLKYYKPDKHTPPAMRTFQMACDEFPLHPSTACVHRNWTDDMVTNDSSASAVATGCSDSLRAVGLTLSQTLIGAVSKKIGGVGSGVFSFTVELLPGFARSSVKETTCVTFMAQSSQEAVEWFTAFDAVTVKTQSFRDTSKIRSMCAQQRAGWLNRRNSLQETPLHCLAKCSTRVFADRDAEEDPVKEMAVLSTASWLIDQGCSLDAVNNRKLSALDLATAMGNGKFVKFIQQRADAMKNMRDVTGVAPAAGGDADVNLFDVYEGGHSTFARRNSAFGQGHNPAAAVTLGQDSSSAAKYSHANLFPAPPKVRGCCYLSFHFQKFFTDDHYTGAGLSALRHPFLSIAVYSENHELLEMKQDITAPAVQQNSALWWGTSWHMQTPLEAAVAGCYVLVLLKALSLTPVPGKDEAMELAWCKYVIDHNTIDSGLLTMAMKKLPVMEFGGNSVTSCTGAAHGVEYPSDHSFLDTDISITRQINMTSTVNPASPLADVGSLTQSGSQSVTPLNTGMLQPDKQYPEHLPVIYSLAVLPGMKLMRFQMTIPRQAVEGQTIRNVGGKRRRSIKIPKGVKGGDSVIVVAPADAVV